MSHLLLPVDMLIHELHDLTGVEAILFTQIDEETTVSSLGPTLPVFA